MSTCTQWVDKGVIECKQWADRWTRGCQDWAENVRRVCDGWADEGYSRCDRYEDQGYDSCSSWSQSCSDWLPWPLSYLCDVFEWVCDAWVWVSHVVCVVAVWVSKWVCKIWAYIVEYVCVAWFWLVEAFCTVWSWVAKLVCIAWDKTRCLLVGIGEVIAGLFGRRPRRRRKIKHVFVLMLENRSFDHMFGFSDIRGSDASTGLATQINNLIGNPAQNIDPVTGNPVFAAQPADFALSSEAHDPGHEFHDALEQMAGAGAVYTPGGPYPPINNSGFVANYRDGGAPFPEKVMQVYASEQLPILNALAGEFAVCDNWFSSMPGPTWPNRLFVHAASSAGLDDSPGTWDTVTTTLIDGYRFDNGTIYDCLEDKCLDWLVFEGDETPQVFSLSGMNFNALQGRFRNFEDFRDSVNDKAFPASYSFIEPNYGNIMPWTPEDFTCGNSQHPLDDVTRGERLIKDVYEAVRNSPHWESSVIIVTHDETGGFFDHVAPPPAVHPGDSITDNENNHNNFDFSQTGSRVPAVVISPWIPRNRIDHLVHDHSSVVKTIAELFSLAPSPTATARLTASRICCRSLRRGRMRRHSCRPWQSPGGAAPAICRMRMWATPILGSLDARRSKPSGGAERKCERCSRLACPSRPFGGSPASHCAVTSAWRRFRSGTKYSSGSWRSRTAMTRGCLSKRRGMRFGCIRGRCRRGGRGGGRGRKRGLELGRISKTEFVDKHLFRSADYFWHMWERIEAQRTTIPTCHRRASVSSSAVWAGSAPAGRR
jgi:phospholipase C